MLLKLKFYEEMQKLSKQTQSFLGQRKTSAMECTAFFLNCAHFQRSKIKCGLLCIPLILFFLLKRDVWRTKNWHVSCFPLTKQLNTCLRAIHFIFSNVCTPLTQKELKISQWDFRFWFLRNFSFRIFIFKALFSSIPNIWDFNKAPCPKRLESNTGFNYTSSLKYLTTLLYCMIDQSD